ncbi:MAG: argininosuccinate lyase [Acidobacteriota bacterium]
MSDSEQEGKPETTPWSGRFTSEVHPVVQRFTRSIHFDKRLAMLDIRGSEAHVRMLAEQGIIPESDRDAILDGLERIRNEIREGSFPFRDELEDIHMNIETRLQELIGEPGERLHTGRSRNDQVALDVKLYCLETASAWRRAIVGAVEWIVDRAGPLKQDVFPAWTHLQAAQPVSWAHYLLAFAAMLARDEARLDSYCGRHSVSPLGAGALSGSSLPLDPAKTASELDFNAAFGNSYDVVGDRDAVLELSQAACQIMIHLSRLAEDFIYMSSTPVKWIELPDALCTGSSMMPQKKNPDLLELTRGKTASVIGHSQALTVLLKGLPTSYHRDLQQDKEHLFAIADIVEDALKVLQVLLEGFEVRREQAAKALSQGFLMATELAEYLVARGVPFRSAHRRVGELVRHCVEEGLELHELPEEELLRLIPEADADVLSVLDPRCVLTRRTHSGSTGLGPVEKQLGDWRSWLAERRPAN